MDVSKFSKLLTAISLFLLNTTISELLRLQTSLMMFISTINASYILTFMIGAIAGFLGDVLIVIVEIVTLVIIYFLRLNVSLDVSLITSLLIPYLMGVALGSSFFRKLYVTSPKIVIEKGTLGDFLMILGSSLIVLYFFLDLPNIQGLLLSDVRSMGLKLYLVLLGLICNSFILSTSTRLKFNPSLESVLKYVLTTISTSLSWLTLPTITLINLNYLTPVGNYFVLGKIVKKVGSKLSPEGLYGGYVKVPINPTDNKHVVIVGMSGSGKSHLAMKIIKQLVRKHPVLVIDPHGEYVNLVRELSCGKVLTPTENPINPLETLGKPRNVRAEEVSDMIRRIFRLGSIQKYSLYNLILNTYERLGEGSTPTFNDVYETLINYIEGDSSSRDVYLNREALTTLIPYLNLLRGPYLTSTALTPSDLMHGLTVINLSAVESDYLIGIYIESLLYLIESYVRNSNEPLFIVVDEAHRFMGGKVAPLLSKLVVEGRKFGLGLIIITQQPLDLEASIIANSAYVVSFAIQEVTNLNYISKVLCGSYTRCELVKNLLANLKKHEALVRVGDGGLYIIKA